MVAEIEPPQEHDTSDTLPEQNPGKTLTPEKVATTLLDTFQTDPAQRDDTFLRFVCEIYVKWTELPLAVRAIIENWSSLPRDVIESFERIAQETSSHTIRS